MPNVHEATTPEQSMALDRGGARIIISASGMGSGGRVTHHLKALLPDRDNTVLLVGFQAVGTPGRMLLDGAHEIKIHGQYVPVRAEIVEIEAFSVHADASELVDWLMSCADQAVAGVRQPRRAGGGAGAGRPDPPGVGRRGRRAAAGRAHPRLTAVSDPAASVGPWTRRARSMPTPPRTE